MALTIEEIARRLGGLIEGEGTTEIGGVAALDEAGPGEVTFLHNPRYSTAMKSTRASAVLVNESWKGETSATLIRVKSADAAFAQVAAWLARPAITYAPGIHPTAVIADSAILGRSVHVGPHCVIESGVKVGDRSVLVAGCYIGRDCLVGEECLFYPHVTIREYTQVGNRVILHNGAVIGSDGFGYVREAGHWKKVPQVGIVVLGDDVEIGANTTVDRARFGETRIGNGVKIDNLVQVAHNVTIGEDAAIAAQVGISGSSHIGARVQMGGQAGVAGHLYVGNDSVVGGQAGVLKDVPPAIFVSGYPAMPHDAARKAHAHMMRIPELKKKVAGIEQRLEALEGKT
ncbi:MAG: UDP-3-O-(3-hydroxymyristoyl)glucosamine N-acyltransferase [bacterium]